MLGAKPHRKAAERVGAAKSYRNSAGNVGMSIAQDTWKEKGGSYKTGRDENKLPDGCVPAKSDQMPANGVHCDIIKNIQNKLRCRYSNQAKGKKADCQ